MKRSLVAIGTLLLGMLGLLTATGTIVAGCGDDDENAGQSCESVDDCYPELDPADIQGDIVCMDRVAGGYCTHLCQDDSDCCAADGECPSGHPQVCAPFESTNQYYCFLSCEDADVGDENADTYCQDFASEEFGCRSTGGGSDNRKICSP